jgi:putative Holliday junction resolvase
MSIPGGLEMTTSKDVLEALSTGAGPRKVLVSLGYSAWGEGQLESELGENSWLTVDADMRGDLRHAGGAALRQAPQAAGPAGLDAVARGRGMREDAAAVARGPAPPARIWSDLSWHLDFGLKRTGVASRQPAAGTAQPRGTIQAEGDARLAQVAAHAQWQPDALVVGVPFHPDGAEHENTQRARKFARQLRGRFKAAGVRGGRALQHHRGPARRRAMPDAGAACIILEQFLRSLA